MTTSVPVTTDDNKPVVFKKKKKRHTGTDFFSSSLIYCIFVIFRLLNFITKGGASTAQTLGVVGKVF